MLATIRKVIERREDGASAVEYGLLVAAIAALIVLIVFALGRVVNEVFRLPPIAFTRASCSAIALTYL